MTKGQRRQLVTLTADVAWLLGYLEALMNATKSDHGQHIIAAETSTNTLVGLLELIELTKVEAEQ